MNVKANNPSSPAGAVNYRVALVEDRTEVREQWAALIETYEDFSCVGAFATGEEAIKTLPSLSADIVLMDIMLPGMSGIECTARLKEMFPEMLIVILTVSDDEELIFPALEAGADGYLLKQSSLSELHEGLLDVLQGGVPMTSGIARRVTNYFRQRSKKRSRVKSLSQRENEVLDLLAKGYSNKEIADKLSLSVETIRSYLKNIYEKMHVHSRAEAVANYITGSERG